MGFMTARHTVPFLCSLTLSTACDGAYDRQTGRQTLRRCDLDRALGEHIWCVQILFEWWNPVLPLPLFYTARLQFYRRSLLYHSLMKTLYLFDSALVTLSSLTLFYTVFRIYMLVFTFWMKMVCSSNFIVRKVCTSSSHISAACSNNMASETCLEISGDLRCRLHTSGHTCLPQTLQTSIVGDCQQQNITDIFLKGSWLCLLYS